MVEKYYLKSDIVEQTIGELHYDLDKREYKAFIYDNYNPDNGYPTKLFGFRSGWAGDKFPFSRQADHERVWKWFLMRVTPKSRQLIEEYLKAWGLKRYDVWEIIKATNARYCNEPFYIEEFK